MAGSPNSSLSLPSRASLAISDDDELDAIWAGTGAHCKAAAQPQPPASKRTTQRPRDPQRPHPGTAGSAGTPGRKPPSGSDGAATSASPPKAAAAPAPPARQPSASQPQVPRPAQLRHQHTRDTHSSIQDSEPSILCSDNDDDGMSLDGSIDIDVAAAEYQQAVSQIAAQRTPQPQPPTHQQPSNTAAGPGPADTSGGGQSTPPRTPGSMAGGGPPMGALCAGPLALVRRSGGAALLPSDGLLLPPGKGGGVSPAGDASLFALANAGQSGSGCGAIPSRTPPSAASADHTPHSKTMAAAATTAMHLKPTTLGTHSHVSIPASPRSTPLSPVGSRQQQHSTPSGNHSGNTLPSPGGARGPAGVPGPGGAKPAPLILLNDCSSTPPNGGNTPASTTSKPEGVRGAGMPPHDSMPAGSSQPASPMPASSPHVTDGGATSTGGLGTFRRTHNSNSIAQAAGGKPAATAPGKNAAPTAATRERLATPGCDTAAAAGGMPAALLSGARGGHGSALSPTIQSKQRISAAQQLPTPVTLRSGVPLLLKGLSEDCTSSGHGPSPVSAPAATAAAPRPGLLSPPGALSSGPMSDMATARRLDLPGPRALMPQLLTTSSPGNDASYGLGSDAAAAWRDKRASHTGFGLMGRDGVSAFNLSSGWGNLGAPGLAAATGTVLQAGDNRASSVTGTAQPATVAAAAAAAVVTVDSESSTPVLVPGVAKLRASTTLQRSRSSRGGPQLLPSLESQRSDVGTMLVATHVAAVLGLGPAPSSHQITQSASMRASTPNKTTRRPGYVQWSFRNREPRASTAGADPELAHLTAESVAE